MPPHNERTIFGAKLSYLIVFAHLIYHFKLPSSANRSARLSLGKPWSQGCFPLLPPPGTCLIGGFYRAYNSRRGRIIALYVRKPLPTNRQKNTHTHTNALPYCTPYTISRARDSSKHTQNKNNTACRFPASRGWPRNHTAG